MILRWLALRLALAIVMAGVWFAVMTQLLPRLDAAAPDTSPTVAHHVPAPATRVMAHAPTDPSRTAAGARGGSGAVAVVWSYARLPLLILAVVVAGVLAMRWTARRHRQYARLRVIPARADQAEPEQIARLLGVWHQLLVQRWYTRLLWGQPSLSLEVRTVPDAGGDLCAHLSIVCPAQEIKAIEGSLLACYRDAKLTDDDATLPAGESAFRLKKRAHFVRALRTPDDERPLAVDSVLRQMASAGEASVLQFALVPTPLFFDRYARWRFRREERSAEGHGQRAAARSEVLAAELKGGLSVQHRPLFFTDIRIASPTPAICTAIAGIVRGESVGENGLVVRHMHPWARGPLYLRRLQAGLGNPIPNWRRGVLSSTELATLWHLPSPGLRTVRIERSPVPRIPAPPEITREPAYALARDERGLVGIRPQDKSDGLGLIGGQKTGKTSLLCRTVQADANDADCALIVLMPKPGDALKALSMVPRTRRVHFLDLQHPEFGINPLLAGGDPAMVADKIVEAFRDVNMEGDIRGSSDRYLRQAAQAAIGASRSGAIEGPPTLWHMYRMLLPAEESFREHVVNAILPDPRFADTATFFGRELPYDLQNAGGQTTAKLDAPRNKLLRLMVESLDKVLRHPRQVSLDQIVRDRDVLIVDGKMGTFGSDNTRVMLQFILNSLYGTLQRQQQMPEQERVRVALKVDEAHLILNESFADALATLRSAGLEVVAAWQYGKQIQDEKIRAGMMSLLRQRCMFSMGESEDARDMSNIAMSVYADMIRPEAESRQHLRVTPDTIFNLPNHHALCSWISDGARAASFLIQTMPLEENAELARYHLDAQRERGGFVPDRMPDPLPDLDAEDLREFASEITPGLGGGGAGANGADPPRRGFDEEVAELLRVAADGAAPTGRAERTDEQDEAAGRSAATRNDGQAPAGGLAAGEPEPPREDESSASCAQRGGWMSEDDVDAPTPPRVESRPPKSAAGVARAAPRTFVELDLDGVRGIIWNDVTPQPGDRRPTPTHRELAILGALWGCRVLFATQIHRRWWPETSLRSAQQGLNRMLRAGWVRRFKFRLEERGAQQSVYALTRDGFELAQGRNGPRGAYINERANWREPRLDDPRRVLRDLHVNGWVLALEQIAGKRIERWRGQNESRLDPPRRKVRGEWAPLRPADVLIGTSTRLRNVEAVEFEQLTPDATIEMRIPTADPPIRFDVLIEMDRARSQAATAERLRRYDGLVAGWASMLERYKALRTPPMVVFVSEDEPARDELVRLADRVVVACHAKPGTRESDWRFPTRRVMFFAAERDIHEGSLRALALPDHPPDVRAGLKGSAGLRCEPRHVSIIDPRLLGRD